MDVKYEGKFGDDSNKCQCPKCSYPHASLRNIARRGTTFAGLATGGVSGVIGGAAAFEGTQAGSVAGGILGGPIGVVVGGVIGGLSGAAVGAFAGHITGRLTDKDVIGLYYCPKCGHSFLP